MFAQISTDDHTTMTQQFARVMQIDPQTSQFFLESSNWDVQLAINAFLATAGHAQEVYQQNAPPQAALLTDLSQLQSIQLPPLTPIQMNFSFQNVGQEAWPADSRLVFVDGHNLDGPNERRVHPAAPGQQIDLPIELRTPAEAGIYAGTWRLTCASGYFSDPLWLVFTVVDQEGEEMTDALSKFSVGGRFNIGNQASQSNPFQTSLATQPPRQQPQQAGLLQQPMFAFQPPVQPQGQQQLAAAGNMDM